MNTLHRKIKSRVLNPILAFLNDGVSPERLTLAIAAGLAIGIFPVIGVTTIMATVAALTLRLNLPAVLLANFAVYPLQIALLLPFYGLGAWITGLEPLTISTGEMAGMFGDAFWASFGHLWDITMGAVLAWSVICLPLAALLYACLMPLVRRLEISGSDTIDHADGDVAVSPRNRLESMKGITKLQPQPLACRLQLARCRALSTKTNR